MLAVALAADAVEVPPRTAPPPIAGRRCSRPIAQRGDATGMRQRDRVAGCAVPPVPPSSMVRADTDSEQ